MRRGKVTASRIPDVLARTKNGYGASRANYMAELVAEILTDTTAESYQSPAMVWGIENEPLALSAYCFRTDNAIGGSGFVVHPTIAQAGASPDGLIREHGLIEVKCPFTSTHIDTLLSGEVDSKYVNQIQFQLACTGRKWCDYVSFDPRMPERMKLFVQRVQRDDAAIKAIEHEVVQFIAELNSKVARLREKFE